MVILTFASSCASLCHAGRAVADEVDVEAVLQSGKNGLGQTHLRRNAGHEQLLAARGVNSGADLWVEPRMGRRAIDRRDVGEDLADLFEDRVSKHTSVGPHCREHRWHTEDLRRSCESRDVVDQESRRDGRRDQRDSRLMVDQEQSRIFDGQFIRILRHDLSPPTRH
jgi:hypothetical protein